MSTPSPRTITLRNVVVTGTAATTSLAGDLDGTWEGLLNSQSGIGVLEDDFVTKYDLPVRIGGHLKVSPDLTLTRVEIRRMAFAERLALSVARVAWANAGKPEVESERLAVAIGTGIGGADALVDATEIIKVGGYRKVSPLAVQMVMPNGPSAVVGLELQARAGVITPVSACSSGSEAIANAWRLIAMGDADVVVTGGVEGQIEAVPIAAFSMMRAMSTRNDDPAAASRPFDKDRDGFVFGEAGAVMVLESEEHARARGANILARVMGAGITSDGFHIVAPDPTGAGAARAMARAIELAGLSKTDIDHVNAHATSTPVGDSAESKAINLAVGDHASVWAPKSALGHSIGAVGALESVLTVKTITEGVIPPTLNLETLDPEINLDVVHGSPRKADVEYAINNSFGFGGHNVAIAFGRP